MIIIKTRFKNLLLTIALVAVLFSGCADKDGYTNKTMTNQAGYYSLYYTGFSGEDFFDFHVTTDKSITINIVTHKGKLDMEVFSNDEDGRQNSIYYGKELATGSSSIYLEKGSYSIKAYGIKHSGGFSILY